MWMNALTTMEVAVLSPNASTYLETLPVPVTTDILATDTVAQVTPKNSSLCLVVHINHRSSGVF